VPEHHEHNTVDQMIAIMSKYGWRITEQRRTIAEIFAGVDGYLSPKDVYDRMTVSYPGLSFDTVYRNLRLLTEMGALEQFYFLDGGLKFRALCEEHHHHHLICTNCEKTIAFDYCPMERRPELPGSFRIAGHRFEIYGQCEDCQTESG